MYEELLVDRSLTEVKTKSTIICFKQETKKLPKEYLNQLENDLNSKISILTSWPEFTHVLANDMDNNCPTLVLLDVKVLDSNSTIPEIVNTISTLHRCMGCTTPISIAVTIDDTKHTIEFIRELQAAGILGIVPCNDHVPYERTIESMSALLSGRQYWPRDLVLLITSKTTNKPYHSGGIHLTSRQEQVLSLVCHRGLSNKKIAASLKISESTVKIHISAIMKAYGVRNRTQLVLAASSSLQA